MPGLTALSAGVFLLSGFCGLLYQVVWIRLAFASFGIILPVLSVVVSVFMLGLAIGSWGAAGFLEWWQSHNRRSAIWAYVTAEAGIAAGAFVVPKLFSLGSAFLLDWGQSDSSGYLAASAVMIAVSILPWCMLMGATFPLMLRFFKEIRETEQHAFSHLYAANVIGATLGTLLTAFVLIELLGFSGTLLCAALGNLSAAATAVLMAIRFRRSSAALAQEPARREEPPQSHEGPVVLLILFTTGLASMALEVSWIRAYTPVLGTTVYAFASLLATYLIATFLGSLVYRVQLARRRTLSTSRLVSTLAAAALFPIALNDPRIALGHTTVLVSILPLCFLLGYLTPKLVDEYSRGDARLAGRAYAVNIVGCILGPLLASYYLLAAFGSRIGMTWIAMSFVLLAFLTRSWPDNGRFWRRSMAGITAALALGAVFVNIGYEDGRQYKGAVVRRDHVATVISYGSGVGPGGKRLLVNGIGITHLNPLTKMMAHLPLALLDHEPRRAAVICFGMGTTFRSLLTWEIEVKGVELVPSVRDAFGYYFDDAESLLADPRGEVVIDDGRRYLLRNEGLFDVITIDPPPPVEAEGSSLLYSKEFYDILKRRLTDGGILQQWYPGSRAHGDRTLEQATRNGYRSLTLHAVARSLHESFEHVYVYRSFQGWGWHFLASMRPIERRDAESLVGRLPPAARADLAEWFAGDPEEAVRAIVRRTLESEVDIERLLGPSEVRITDDKPFNEYFLLRRSFRRLRASP